MLSIIVPVRNSQDFIGECLRSIITQEVGGVKYEVLISDNCSTDGTVGAIDEILRKHPDFAAKVRVFHQKKNLGAYGNLNFLLAHCSYAHAHILCADDRYSSGGSLRRITETICTYPEAGIFVFDNNTNHASQDHWKWIEESVGDKVISATDCLKFLFAFGCFLGGLSNICIDRSKFVNLSYFDPHYLYFGDVEFYARAAIHGVGMYLSRRQVTFREHHDQSISSTQNRSNATCHESVATITLLFNRLRALGVPPAYMRFYASCGIAQFYHAAFKSLLLDRQTSALRRIMSAHRGSPAFYHPLVCLTLAGMLWPKLYRARFHSFSQRRFVGYINRAVANLD